MLIDHENLAALDVALMPITPDPSTFICGFNESHLENARVMHCFSFPRDYEEATRELLYERFSGIKHQCDNKYAFKRHNIIQEFEEFMVSAQSLLKMNVVSPEEIATFHTPKTVVTLGQKTLTQIVVENHVKHARPRDDDTRDMPVKRFKYDPASTVARTEEPAIPGFAEPVSTAAVAAVAASAVAVPVPIDIENAQKAVHMSVYALLKAHRSNKQPSTDIKDKIYALIHLQLQAGIRERDTSNIYTVPVEFKFDHININFNMETRKIAISVTPKNLSRAKFSTKRKTFPIGAA